MPDAGRDTLTEFVGESPGSRPPIDPGQYVLRSPWFYPSVIGGTAGLFAALYSAAHGIAGLLAFAIVGTLAGVVLTMIAMAWAVAIVFADDTRRGLWFVIFPPYMPVYAVLRWKWMAQPSVLFLCGLTLAIASLWTTQQLAASLAVPRQLAPDVHIHDSSIRLGPVVG